MNGSLQGIQCQAASTDLVHGEVPQPPSLSIPDPLWLPHQDPRQLPLQAVQLPQLLLIQTVRNLNFWPDLIFKYYFHKGKDMKHPVAAMYNKDKHF